MRLQAAEAQESELVVSESSMESAFRKWIKSNIRVGLRTTAKSAIFEVTAALQTHSTALFHRARTGNNLN